MIIPTPGSIVKTVVMGKERIILVEKIILSHDNLYLIRYTDSSDRRSYINCSYVTEIVSHEKSIPKPLNYFSKDNPSVRYLCHGRKNYSGSLVEIIAHCMSKLPYSITVPLDSNKCHELWKKTKPGFTGKFDFFGDGSGVPIMKKEKIHKWVSVNWPKLLIDKKEWQKDIDARNKELADEYWAFVEDEMDRDFEEAFENM